MSQYNLKTEISDSSELRADRRPVVLLVAASVLVLTLFFIVGSLLHRHIDTLTRDICAIAKLPPYVGIVSQIGLFCWFSMATLCLFSSVERSSGEPPFAPQNSELKTLLRFSGILLILVGIDDAFMLHEYVLPEIGIPETVTYLVYLLGGTAYLFRFGKTLLRTRYFFLIWAVLSFALSMLIDKGLIPLPFFEDGTKFIGIVSLLIYFIDTTNSEIQRELSRNRAVILDSAAAELAEQ